MITGIIGAMPEEVQALLEALEWSVKLVEKRTALHCGVLEGQPVMLAECGVGKVNAALLAQTMVMKGIGRIIFTGVAAGLDPDLKVGDIVISEDTMQHDVNASALGYNVGQVPGESFTWKANKKLINVALDAASEIKEVQTMLGRVVSGDQFIADDAMAQKLHADFGATCVEMEGAAVAQVCAKARVPFVIIRSISDLAGNEAKVDFKKFTPLAASRAAQLVRSMVKKLA